MEKKIAIGKSDEATVVAEKIIDAPGEAVILAIPRFSRLAESGANFRLLRREAEAVGKKLIIESIDEATAELAKANGIECRNPFFNEPMKRFSDIVTGKSETHHAKVRETPLLTHTREAHRDIPEPRDHFSRQDSVETRGKGRRSRLMIPNRPLIYLGIALALIAISGIIGFTVLPRADIQIVAAKTEWSFAAPVVVDSSIATVDAALRKIPGQMFKDKKNLDLSFPASGKGKVNRKATGVITIWNAHGTAPQSLVENTRFATPDGKIFRLTKRIVVPGATIQNGKIVPVSFDAEVAADKPGETGNIGPVSRFTIPGFAGTPKANTFYAESKTAMTGGFIGETAYPTASDISKAKTAAAEALEDSMRLVVLAGLDPSFKVVPGATSFKVTSQRVQEATDADGKFSVFTEGEMAVMAFREADVLDVLASLLEAQGASDFEVRSYELKYGTPVFSTNGGLSLPLDYRSALARKIDPDDLKGRIAGKSEADLRSIIFSVPGVESAKVALWPFWVRWIPNNADRISIAVD
ncbi:MAG: hypothetical protein AAB518_01040 [Patescibacteria group bacterium]